MTEIKRITPDEVVEAYKRTGWRPIQEAFYDRINGQHCGCGLSVLVGDAEKVLQMEGYIGRRLQLFANELGLSVDYVRGFTRGFDGDIFWQRGFWQRGFWQRGESDIRLIGIGYQDGRAAWEAVKREVLDHADVE